MRTPELDYGVYNTVNDGASRKQAFPQRSYSSSHAQAVTSYGDFDCRLRGDGGFCRDNLLTWCEENRVDYVFGLAKNKRLLKIIGRELHLAQQEFQSTGKAARQFADFEYRTKQSWSRPRRVVGKAEHLAKGSNPRFVVTSLSLERFTPREFRSLAARSERPMRR